jgi:hypothetical protein
MHVDIVVGDRTSNFIIGLTNSTPANNSRVGMGSYAQCFQWPGTVPDGKTVFAKCAANLSPGRFVVFMAQASLMPVCELQVYAAGTSPALSRTLI